MTSSGTHGKQGTISWDNIMMQIHYLLKGIFLSLSLSRTEGTEDDAGCPSHSSILLIHSCIHSHSEMMQKKGPVR